MKKDKKMYAASSAIATDLPRCTLAPDGRSGRTTAYIWLAPAVARPIFCSVPLCKTSDIRKRFDVMITECAPLDSMTQRFGRINRKRTTDTIGNYKSVYVIAPPVDKSEALPYDVDVLNKSFKILPNGGVLHERSIQEKIDKVFDRINFLKIEEVSAYGENGKWNIPLLTHHSNSILMELLEIDSVVCITEDDIEAYENSKHDDRMQFEIPMRYYSVKDFPSLNLGRRPYVIPSSAYNEDIGLSMKALKENHVENQIL